MFEKEKCAALLEISNIKLRGLLIKGLTKKQFSCFQFFLITPRRTY